MYIVNTHLDYITVLNKYEPFKYIFNEWIICMAMDVDINLKHLYALIIDDTPNTL